MGLEHLGFISKQHRSSSLPGGGDEEPALHQLQCSVFYTGDHPIPGKLRHREGIYLVSE